MCGGRCHSKLRARSLQTKFIRYRLTSWPRPMSSTKQRCSTRSRFRACRCQTARASFQTRDRSYSNNDLSSVRGWGWEDLNSQMSFQKRLFDMRSNSLDLQSIFVPETFRGRREETDADRAGLKRHLRVRVLHALILEHAPLAA